jgi:predicted acyltransferase (DUF342 family)
MKNIIVIVLFLISSTVLAQEKNEQKIQIVEVSCGQCKFNISDKKGCDLAIRIEGKSYFVEGTTIDDHGDAHAKDGFCQTIRKAEVMGEIKEDKFVITYFKLLPEKNE